jgi:hypothetical protein
MSEEVYFLLDKRNNYILNIDEIRTSNYIYLSLIGFSMYWYYIYYHKKLSNQAVIAGISSTIILFGLHYLSDNLNTYLGVDKDNWFIYKDLEDNLITDFNDIKDINNIKDFDNQNKGLIVNKKYIDHLKKHEKIIPEQEYMKERNIKYIQNITNKKSISQNILNSSKGHSFQAYTLVTILFTILSLTWNVDKKLFDKLLPFFIYAISLSIPTAFSFFWTYNFRYYENIMDIKKHFLFQGLSVTLAILTEILVINQK